MLVDGRTDGRTVDAGRPSVVSLDTSGYTFTVEIPRTRAHVCVCRRVCNSVGILLDLPK